MAAGQKLGMSMAMAAAERVESVLADIYGEVRQLRLYQTQRRYFELPRGGQAPVGTSEWFFPHLTHGQTFIVDRLTAFAPEGTQLEIYENNVQASNFREVVTNVQRYANSVPGTLNFEGPNRLIAVLSLVKAEGPFAITLSGFLVPTNLRDLEAPPRYQPAER